MRTPLVWHLVWPLLVVLMAAGSLGVLRERAHMTFRETQDEVTAASAQAERVTARLRRQHTRFVDRFRDVVAAPPDDTSPPAGPMVDGYAREMGRLIQTVSASKDAEEAQTPGLVGNRRRLRTQSITLTAAHRQVLEALRVAADLTGDATRDAEGTTLVLDHLTEAHNHFLTQLAEHAFLIRQRAHLTREAVPVGGPTLPAVAYLILGLLGLGVTLTHGRRLGQRLREPLAATPRPRSREESELMAWARRTADKAKAHNDDVESLAQRNEKSAAGLRRQERELGLMRLYTENLMNNLSAAVVVTDVHHTITATNRRAETLLACGPDRIGQSIAQHPLVHGITERTSVPPEALLNLEAAEDRRFEKLPLASSTGEEHLIDLRLSPYRDEMGRARGCLWIAEDVTEAVHTKNQLLASERLAAVGQLSSQVAHEIRNPLSAIGLNAELLHDDFASQLPAAQQDEANTLLRAIAAEIERLTEVTEGYLHLSRLPRPTPEPTNVNRALADLLAMLDPEMRQHNVTVQMRFEEPAPLASADPGQLRQALLNVVRNAREAIGKGGTILVTTRREADGVVVAVEDSGPGIDDGERVFEPFFTTKRTGTGLGLSITQQILEEHGGRIAIAGHDGIDGGAAVRLRWPAVT